MGDVHYPDNDDDSFTYEDQTSNGGSVASGSLAMPANRGSTAGSNRVASFASLQPSRHSLLVSPRNRGSFVSSTTDNDSGDGSILEVPLAPPAMAPINPVAQPRRPVTQVNSLDMMVEASSPPSAPHPSTVTESFNQRMAADVRRFFGLESDPAMNNVSLYPTINEPPPPAFTDSAAALTRNFSQAVRTLRRTGSVRQQTVDEEAPSYPPPAVRAVPVQARAPPPSGVPMGARNAAGEDDDFEFYDQEEPPAYDDVAAPPARAPGRNGFDPVPPSVAYRQRMGIAEPGLEQQGQGQAQPRGRGRPQARDPQNPYSEEELAQPGMTILRDPKVREQLAKMTVVRPIFLILCTIVQCAMLFYELYYNDQVTGAWITAPATNWMIGPTSTVLIDLGSSFAPCITTTDIYTNAATICPVGLNGTFYTEGTETAYCGDLGAFCEMGGFPSGSPDQWWRFFTAIYVHGGVIHLLVNMAAQWRLGFDIERSMGHIRVIIIYFSSGLWGFMCSALFNKLTRKSPKQTNNQTNTAKQPVNLDCSHHFK